MTPTDSADRMRLIAAETDPLRAERQAVDLMLSVLDATGHRDAAEHYRFGVATRFEEWAGEAGDTLEADE